MKALTIFSTLFLSIAIANSSFAQDKTETIPVSGNCGMCKSKIEKAATTAGAKSATWDVQAKAITIQYNASTTNAAKIQQGIAAAGYDTRDVKAENAAYDKLHACCKYERVAKTTTHCTGKCEMKDGKCTDMTACKDKGCCKEHSGDKDKACCSADKAGADGKEKSCCSKETH